jgi:UDP-2-acetamido-3-amino-2,3-dideoxy-glucuronate N-acetyltransferase
MQNKLIKQNGFKMHSSSIVESTDIGDGTVIWAFSHVSKGVSIGKNCMIGEGVHIGNNVKIGNNCKIQNHSLIYEGVILEDDVFIGPNVITTNDLYPRAFGEWTERFAKTLIKRGAGVGANSTIVCGTTLGEFCMVGAGSVVVDDVMNQSLVKGNPARHTRFMSDIKNSPFHGSFRNDNPHDSSGKDTVCTADPNPVTKDTKIVFVNPTCSEENVKI